MARFNQFIKKVTIDNITYDSKQEYEYYLILQERLEKGEISDLEIHKSFELIHNYEINGKKQKGITYEADFVFYDKIINKWRYIDVKGFADDVFKLKKKIFEYYYQVELEVLKYTKTTGWVSYDEYKKAKKTALAKKTEEKNYYKNVVLKIEKDNKNIKKLIDRKQVLISKEKLSKVEQQRIIDINILLEEYKKKGYIINI